MARIKEVKTGWREIVLVCRKCTKRLDGGFGPAGGRRLARELRAHLHRDGVKNRHSAITVKEVGCLGICPKGAVMALRSGVPDRLLAVPAGMPPEAVLEALGIIVPGSKNGPAGPS